MSDCYVRILPESPEDNIDTTAVTAIIKYLSEYTVSDSIRCVESAAMMFVDCGGNLDRIVCPHCGGAVDFGWWGERMTEAHAGRFADLRVVMPCCAMQSSLIDLLYDFPCGFAKTMIEMRNPQIPVSEACLVQLRRMAKCSVRLIAARY